jgi:hypothetical protein
MYFRKKESFMPIIDVGKASDFSRKRQEWERARD